MLRGVEGGDGDRKPACVKMIAVVRNNNKNYNNNKKAVLSQGNRAMPQLFFSV